MADKQINYIDVQMFHPYISGLYADAFKMIHDSEQAYVPLVINSYGGYVDCLSTMLDEIDNSEKPVITIVTGVAMSCGAVLATSGTKGLRFIGNNARFMVHEAAGGARGKSSDVLNDAKDLQNMTDKLVYERFDKQAGKPEGYTKNLVKDNFNADLFLNANEALAHGYMDSIMSRNKALNTIDALYSNYLDNKQKEITNNDSYKTI